MSPAAHFAPGAEPCGSEQASQKARPPGHVPLMAGSRDIPLILCVGEILLSLLAEPSGLLIVRYRCLETIVGLCLGRGEFGQAFCLDTDRIKIP